jgi:hypothetical protein
MAIFGRAYPMSRAVQVLRPLAPPPTGPPVFVQTLLPTRNRPGLGPMSHYVQMFNYPLPVPVAAPIVGAGTLPFMGVG